MSRPRPCHSLRARRTLASSTLMTAGVWLCASACGPSVATPMPEPPTFDLSGFGGGVANAKVPLDPSVLVIESGTGNVPAGATVRVTNLDGTDPVVAGTGNPQGGFEVDLLVTDGQELRFEWVNGGEHSAPADAIISRPDPLGQGFGLALSPRFACLKLTPGFVLDFAGGTTATLHVENGCADAVVLANARTRLGLSDFALPATPPSLAAQQSADVTVNFTRSASGLREDVLFVDVTLTGTTIRYPVTLRAE